MAKVNTTATLDTDAISPDSLKSTFGFLVDRLTKYEPIDWNTLEFAQHRHGDETNLVVRAAQL